MKKIFLALIGCAFVGLLTYLLVLRHNNLTAVRGAGNKVVYKKQLGSYEDTIKEWTRWSDSMNGIITRSGGAFRLNVSFPATGKEWFDMGSYVMAYGGKDTVYIRTKPGQKVVINVGLAERVDFDGRNFRLILPQDYQIDFSR